MTDTEIPATLARADLSLLREVGSEGAPLMAFTAQPPHPANTVELVTRRGERPTQRSRAGAIAAPPGATGQWFTAALPSLPNDAQIDYRAELVRCGQRVAGYPADGSWLALQPDASATRLPAPPPEPPPPAGGPVWSHELTYFATFDAHGSVQPVGETPEGFRIDFIVEGGTVTGPTIDARIQPGGGDWLCIRRDGVAALDIRATFRADGASCYYRARGRLDLGPAGYARAVAGDLHGTPPCYVTPTFHTGAVNWLWLNRIQGLGIGRVLLDEARVCYDVHLPTVGARRA